MTFPNIANIISEETQGNYSFEHIDKEGYNTLYLKDGANVIMYDMVDRPLKTIIEQHLEKLKGDVLICGLGCGFSIFPIIDSEDVDSITVIEKDATVIAMMQPYLPGVTIIEADATTYKPTQNYDSIYLDIWQHNNIELKQNETIRYFEYLKTDGYLNFLNFDEFSVLNSSNAFGSKVIYLNSGMDGGYTHSGTSMTQVKFGIVVPSIASVLPTASKVYAKIVGDFDTEGAADMAVDLFCYTDYIAVPNSEFSITNQSWAVIEQADWIEITELKTFRIRTKRVGGAGGNDISVEGFMLMVKYE